MDFFEKFAKAKEALAKKQEKRREEQEEREKQIRLEELYVKFHEVGPVKLPLPSLYALKWLDERYGDLEKIDLSSFNQLAAVVWILENQHRAGELGSLGAMEIEAEINKRISEIDAALHLPYLAAVQEIFHVLKKNYLQQQKQLLEPLLDLLDRDSSPPGAKSPSH